MLKKSLEDIKEETHFEYEVIDIEEFPEEANTFRVRGVPTLIKFDNGVVVSSLIGMQPKETLKSFVEGV